MSSPEDFREDTSDRPAGQFRDPKGLRERAGLRKIQKLFDTLATKAHDAD